ncbi:hypothetical protein Hanom_Chr02g00155221 [Helianthus anomalus]
MPPRHRGSGRGKGLMRGGPSWHVGPSRYIPSPSFDSDPFQDWHDSYSSARHSVDLLPSYRHSYHSQHSHSHHSSHHSHSQSFNRSFDPNQYINTPPAAQNQLEQYENQNMDVDEDPDLEIPPSGSLAHPIEISSGSVSYAGLPY